MLNEVLLQGRSCYACVIKKDPTRLIGNGCTNNVLCLDLSSFGTTLNAATFNEAFGLKVSDSIEDGTFQPLKEYKHYLFLLAARIQGAKEPTMLTKRDFQWGTMREGQFKGAKYVPLDPNHLGQKKKALSLLNPTRNDGGNKDAHVPIIATSNPLCLYNMLCWHIFEYMPPDCKGEPPNRNLRRLLRCVSAIIFVCLMIASSSGRNLTKKNFDFAILFSI